jgi:hypothetical protein
MSKVEKSTLCTLKCRTRKQFQAKMLKICLRAILNLISCHLKNLLNCTFIPDKNISNNL